jgi:hypothetical protein
VARAARPLALLLPALALWAAGCSDGSTTTLTGTVTLDGQPLPEGTVRLVPTDPTKGGTAGAAIKDGKFTAEVPPGELRVEISAPKVVGKRKAYDTPESPTVDIVEELIPARYNVNSELKVTVKKGGQKETFALLSK